MSRIRIRPAGFDARPHRPSSLRAQARRNYERAAAADQVLRASQTPRPAYRAPDALQIRAAAGAVNLPLVGKERRGTPARQPGAALTPLTLQVQELYENSAVPVREIARLVGVNERTLYKYVQKYAWRRRYNVPGVAPEPKPKPPRPPQPCTDQPRGAGGRFVGRARAGAPAQHGLKALDPVGAARAAALCARAKQVSDAAATQARHLRDRLSRLRALILLLRAERDLAAVAAAQTARARRRVTAAAAAAERSEALRRTLAAKLDALAAEADTPAQNTSAPSTPAPESPAPESSAPFAPLSPRIRVL